MDLKNEMRIKREKLVAINVKKIERRVLKNGHVKKEWGVEFIVDGCVVPICFGSKEAAMIYIGALLKQKVGERLYRADFLKPLALRLPSTLWLEELYNTLFIGADRSFGEWHEKMKKGRGVGNEMMDGGGISQGKCICNRKLNECLDGLCCINARKDENGKTFYEIDIAADNITISEELDGLLCYGNMYTRA